MTTKTCKTCNHRTVIQGPLLKRELCKRAPMMGQFRYASCHYETKSMSPKRCGPDLKFWTDGADAGDV